MAVNPQQVRRVKSGRRVKRKKKKRVNGCFTFLIVLVLIVAAGVFVFNYYDTAKEDFYKMSYPREYSEYVEEAAEEYELEPALIYAVIRTESGFNAEANSPVGACGAMQIMPTTFEWLQQVRECEGTYTESDLYDPEINIDYGSYLLRYFIDYYGTEQAAVAAYNAGFVVSEWLEDPQYSSDGVVLDEIPYPETSEYVKKVESAKEKYIQLYYS